MLTIPSRQAICEALIRLAGSDSSVTVLCGDSRGSGMMEPFMKKFPNRFIETGIAEQNLVSIAAGMAACGRKCFAVSPACFLSTRGMEQAKIDVAYSGTDVTLIGVSGGVSYGALGLTHHALQDIAVMGSMPGMRVFLPSDRHVAAAMIETLARDDMPAYVRVGRNPAKDIYSDGFAYPGGGATQLSTGSDAAIFATGEVVQAALEAVAILSGKGVRASLLDLHCVTPLDYASVLRLAQNARLAVTVEEHYRTGGLGSIIGRFLSEEHPMPVRCLSLPDAPMPAGTREEVLKHYGLDGTGIAAAVLTKLAEL